MMRGSYRGPGNVEMIRTQRVISDLFGISENEAGQSAQRRVRSSLTARPSRAR